VDGEAWTVNAKVVRKVVNVKVVVAGVVPAGPVPVTVMTWLVTTTAVSEAEIAAVTAHVRDGRDGVHGLLVNNTV
jgi:hypothetical protein